MVLFKIVTTKSINKLDRHNLELFSEIFRYEFGSRLFFKNVIGNILLFVPSGFFFGMYLKKTSSVKIILFIFLLSSIIEYIQLLIGRIYDVDDILLNVIGGMIGLLIYKIIFKFINNKKNRRQYGNRNI